jgi:GT2 family glycosyltransferase
MAETVCAVVVTHDRVALLRECLAALAAQTRPPDRVLVVDNASADDTLEVLARDFPDADVLALADNQGGAGGFHEGLRAARLGGADWVWLMDDDTIARPDALAELVAAPGAMAGLPRPLLLASTAEWEDGRLHPMNLPGFERYRPELVIRAASHGLLPLRTTTFVSLLVSREAVDRFGLPPRHFFIWSDDIEYTARILRHDAGYLVPSSVVKHRTEAPHTAVTTAGGRFYYHVRNTLYMIRGDAWTNTEKLPLVWVVLSTSIAYLRHNRFSRASAAIVVRGLRDGIRALPA